MDTSGFCQVGRHGTLSLMKRQSGPGDTEDTPLASFGIDDDELTFGSSTTCGVRLYYSDVDNLHCKIVFDEFKAFLVILGSSGVIVDGCQVYPHTSGDISGSIQQTIVPLNNGSIFEVHGKRFKFNYPPKELRKALYCTPARPAQRALRLSMIHSAQVFSPRPSNDPRENLRILQSPVKKPSGPARNPSPLKSAILPEIEEEEIVLVHTNHPRVVEEEKDLVILEDVPVQLLSPTKATIQQTNQFPVIQVQHQPPCTPRRRSLGGTALHRAVLIRSAQRAVFKAEKEREEEREEMEVFGTVVDNDDGEGGLAMRAAEMEDVDMVDVDEENEAAESTAADGDDQQEGQTQRFLWKKSLERIIPWPFSSSKADTEDNGRQEDELGSSTTNKTDNQKQESAEMFPPIKPSGKVLRNFLTPQPQQHTRKMDSQGGPRPVGPSGRLSLGGQARRVIVEQPWKVHDLVLPATPAKNLSDPLTPVDPPMSSAFSGPSLATPLRTTFAMVATTPTNRSSITEAERQAIQERRRSAVKEFGATPFWAGGAPGMSPIKNGVDSSNIRPPTKPMRTVSPSKKSVPVSLMKERPSPDDYVNQSKDDEDIDTSGLLVRIKETVSDMRRRRSVVLGGSGVLGTPQPSTSLLEDSGAKPIPVNTTSEESAMKRVDFTKIFTPFKTPSRQQSPPKSSSQKRFGNEEQTDIPQEENAPKDTTEEANHVEKPATRVPKAEDEAKPTQGRKRGRPRKNPASSETPQEGVVRPARKASSKVRSSTRRRMPTNTRETDSEDDPLDSYEAESLPPSASTEEDKDVASDSPKATAVKSKAAGALTKGKAAATRIKQEAPLDDAEPVTTTRVGRRTKTTPASKTPDVTPATKPTAGKTRGRPKTPATAPANTGAPTVEEKENSGGKSRTSKLKSAGKTASSEAEDAPVKLRVSRSRTAASRAVNAVEVEDEQAPPARQRATRVMRTRTKTG